jgi:hypothetical protein
MKFSFYLRSMKMKSPQKPYSNDPEAKLARRLKHGKPLTRKEFLKKLEEVRQNQAGKEK